jgi:hypothetical protein
MLSVHDFTLSCKHEEDICYLEHKDHVLKVGCRSCCIKDTFFFVEFFKQYLQYIYTMRKLLINCFCLINKHNHQGQGVLLGHFLCVLSRQDHFWSYVLPTSKKSCASCPASSSTTLLYDCFGWSSLVPYRR